MSTTSSAFSFQERRREAGTSAVCVDMIYFAVGSDAERIWPNLSWAARNFVGQKICFLHILRPSKIISSENTPQDGEKQHIQEILKNYRCRLSNVGLEVGEGVYLQMEKVEEGILALVSRLKIKNLVMGAAASKSMVFIRSKTTGYVSDNVPASCQIWFVNDGHLIRTRFDQLVTGGSSRKDTYHESFRRKKADKESVESSCKETENLVVVKAMAFDQRDIHSSSCSYSSVTEVTSFGTTNAPSAVPVVEISHGEKTEEANSAGIKLNSQLMAAMEERNTALREKSLLEDEIADFKRDNKELTEKLTLSMGLMKVYKNGRDELKAERKRTLRYSKEIKQSGDNSRSNGCLAQLLPEFPYSEIEEATRHFNPSLEIDERGYWRMYKGVFYHTDIAIKLLDADTSNSPPEYHSMVEALSKLGHPNIVTFIGVCHEALAIIYGHAPNGSLEDRLNCKDNSSPLPWQTRICIAADLCSVLIFLHTRKFVHCDLKPANILLDTNFNIKLSHFGLCRAMTIADQSTSKVDVNRLNKSIARMVTQRAAANGGSSQSSSFTSAASMRTIPSDTFVYMDLESVITEEYTPEFDVYSFGIIILRLLTGREAWGIIKEVQLALDNGNLHLLLDCLAGDWPYLQAQQLAKIALRCSDVNRKNRPDLESEVLGVLQKMKSSCQGSRMGSRLRDEIHSQAPPYYICPIYQDVMQDPHVAADGFTYEKEGIQGWLESGHDTSPMTNLTLAHNNLTPNRVLRSAIQDWSQRL